MIRLSNATPNHAACEGRTNCATDTEASTDSRSQAPFYYIFLLVSSSSHLFYYLGQFIDAKPNISGYFAAKMRRKCLDRMQWSAGSVAALRLLGTV